MARSYFIPLLTLLMLWLVATPAASQKSTDAPRRDAAAWLPADTLALARFANVEQFRQQWSSSSFGAQAADPAFAEFFDAVAARLSGLSDDLGIDLVRIWQHAEGELSLGVIRTSSNDLAIVAVADLPSQQDAAALIEQLEASLRDDAAVATRVQLGDQELTSWRHSSDRVIRSLGYFQQGGQIIFSDSLQTLAETARLDSDADETLAKNPNYAHVIERVTPRGDTTGLNWYVNPTAVIETAAGMNLTGDANPELAQTLIKRLRLDQFRGFGGSFWLGQGGMDSVASTYGYLETPVEGFWKALQLPATEQQPPDWVKDDVSIYSQINWSADRFLQAVGELIDQTQGPGTFDQLVGSMQIGDSGMTISDLAQQLAGPIHITAEIPQSAMELTRQRAIFAIEVTDPERLRALADSIAARAGAEASEVAGAALYRYRFDTSELPNLPPLELAVSVTDDAVMFSPNAEYLEATLANRDAGRALADSPRYREIAAQFPSRTSMITYQRQDARMEGLYESLRSGLLGAGGLPGLTGQIFNFDFEKLPPFPSMSRYLQSTGSFIVPQEDGFQIITFATPPREP